MSPLQVAAVLGASGVALGAFAAHGLRKRLEPRALEVFETGVRYQLLHALALLGLAAWVQAGGAAAGATVACWTAGTAVFSGSLYALALGAPKPLGAITPLGGLALIAGWLLLLPLEG